ncbi:putative Glycosyltransferase involved in cell wall bisynthesis [uncultured Defluviicoccus sp.]|uniref:Putative Glycosyltransferase involved in cell wall bisynthesis n=1 Tax=metagenome TaxID=256318 RepID=A0A380TJ12_9ZZZZ|nr:putative Glycosyltransferase involved in cell wall bisynthesis [uncultured Defluviicoccus sp.]
MTQSSTPRVAVGLPVYNGENYLRIAIESVLAQTYRDFELIICDNVSTDSTPAICAAYAERDSRVRYHRNPRNLGAAPNFNMTFKLISPSVEYFRWISHDDTMSPDSLEKSVRALDAHPERVLCTSLIGMIDADGTQTSVYDSGLHAARNSDQPSERFFDTALRKHNNYDTYGLIRRSALENSLMMPSYYAGEKTTLVELSVRGKFFHIPEVLFSVREHAQRATSAISRLNWLSNEDTSASRWLQIGTLMMFLDYCRIVNRHVQAPAERLRCYRMLVQWWFRHSHAAEFASDAVAFVSPKAYLALQSLKHRLVGTERRAHA